MVDDVRLLMHPDVGGTVSDAALLDAEHDVPSSDGSTASKSSGRARAKKSSKLVRSDGRGSADGSEASPRRTRISKLPASMTSAARPPPAGVRAPVFPQGSARPAPVTQAKHASNATNAAEDRGRAPTRTVAPKPFGTNNGTNGGTNGAGAGAGGGARSEASWSSGSGSKAESGSYGDGGDVSDAASTAPASSVATSASARSRGRPDPKRKFASVLAEKHDLLFRMNRMATRGGKQSRPLTVKESLDDLRCECDRMQKEIDVDKSVKFQRSLITSFATGVECLNSRFNFAGIKLDGWSQSIQDDMDQYTEVFEELHAKYATKSTMPPELKLVMMVASSAFMFHMSKSMFSAVPGMEEAMRDDPELARAVAAAVAKKAHQNETVPERKGMAGMFAGLMGGGLGSAGAGAGALGAGTGAGRALTPPSDDIERLFSDDDDSELGSVGGESEDDRSSLATSAIVDPDGGLILDA